MSQNLPVMCQLLQQHKCSSNISVPQLLLVTWEGQNSFV